MRYNDGASTAFAKTIFNINLISFHGNGITKWRSLEMLYCCGTESMFVKCTATYHFLPSVILDKDCVTDHHVAEGSNGNGNQSVPGCEKVEEKAVDEASW